MAPLGGDGAHKLHAGDAVGTVEGILVRDGDREALWVFQAGVLQHSFLAARDGAAVQAWKMLGISDVGAGKVVFLRQVSLNGLLSHSDLLPRAWRSNRGQ